MKRLASGIAEAATPARAITLAELEDLSDDPARDLPGGTDVRAVLHFDPIEGFFLSARDGDTVYIVVDDKTGKQVRYRTVEAAMNRLQDVSHLSRDISLIMCDGVIATPF